MKKELVDNVVDFSAFKKKDYEDRVKQKYEDLVSQAEQEEDAIIDLSIVSTYDIIDLLYEHGYIVTDNPKTIYSIIMIVEAIKSMCHVSKDREDYPFHVLAQEIFNIDDPQKTLNEFLEDS